MNIETLIKQNHAIVYDRDRIPEPSRGLFDAAAWAASDGVRDSAPGRGTALFLETPFGASVLRDFRRGGWAARFSDDLYLFTGYGRSRPFREFDLLARMSGAGLPVPEPLAALCERAGLCYRGALLTRTIPAVVPLAAVLDQGLQDEVWVKMGACIARFHAAGAHHADLNARNVLLRDGGEEVFLVDFDRGRFTPGAPVNGRANLDRLHRSLRKLWPAQPPRPLPDCWSLLLEGYHD